MRPNNFQQIVLQQELCSKKTRNNSFSLRAFASFLDVDSSSLSKVLRGERVFNMKNTSSVAKKLKLKGLRLENFIRAKINDLKIEKIGFENKLVLDCKTYKKIIEDWEYYALLDLVNTKNFVMNFIWIGARLGISEKRAEDVFYSLHQYGFIEISEDGSISTNNIHFCTSEDINSSVLQKAHIKASELAISKIESIDVNLRDYSVITMPVSKDLLPVAKDLIRDFRVRLSELLQSGDSDEVYQMNIQLFPLSKEVCHEM